MNKKYAIIQTGGKQYKVEEGDIVDVELLDAEPGATVNFAQVLFFADGSDSHVGVPNVKDVVVSGELLDMVSGPKITSVKYKPSHHQYRKFGHRQKYSRVKITEISGKSHKESK